MSALPGRIHSASRDAYLDAAISRVAETLPAGWVVLRGCIVPADGTHPAASIRYAFLHARNGIALLDILPDPPVPDVVERVQQVFRAAAFAKTYGSLPPVVHLYVPTHTLPSLAKLLHDHLGGTVRRALPRQGSWISKAAELLAARSTVSAGIARPQPLGSERFGLRALAVLWGTVAVSASGGILILHHLGPIDHASHQTSPPGGTTISIAGQASGSSGFMVPSSSEPWARPPPEPVEEAAPHLSGPDLPDLWRTGDHGGVAAASHVFSGAEPSSPTAAAWRGPPVVGSFEPQTSSAARSAAGGITDPPTIAVTQAETQFPVGLPAWEPEPPLPRQGGDHGEARASLEIPGSESEQVPAALPLAAVDDIAAGIVPPVAALAGDEGGSRHSPDPGQQAGHVARLADSEAPASTAADAAVVLMGAPTDAVQDQVSASVGDPHATSQADPTIETRVDVDADLHLVPASTLRAEADSAAMPADADSPDPRGGATPPEMASEQTSTPPRMQPHWHAEIADAPRPDGPIALPEAGRAAAGIATDRMAVTAQSTPPPDRVVEFGSAQATSVPQGRGIGGSDGPQPAGSTPAQATGRQGSAAATGSMAEAALNAPPSDTTGGFASASATSLPQDWGIGGSDGPQPAGSAPMLAAGHQGVAVATDRTAEAAQGGSPSDITVEFASASATSVRQGWGAGEAEGSQPVDVASSVDVRPLATAANTDMAAEVVEIAQNATPSAGPHLAPAPARRAPALIEGSLEAAAAAPDMPDPVIPSDEAARPAALGQAAPAPSTLHSLDLGGERRADPPASGVIPEAHGPTGPGLEAIGMGRDAAAAAHSSSEVDRWVGELDDMASASGSAIAAHAAQLPAERSDEMAPPDLPDPGAEVLHANEHAPEAATTYTAMETHAGSADAAVSLTPEAAAGAASSGALEQPSRTAGIAPEQAMWPPPATPSLALEDQLSNDSATASVHAPLDASFAASGPSDAARVPDPGSTLGVPASPMPASPSGGAEMQTVATQTEEPVSDAAGDPRRSTARRTESIERPGEMSSEERDGGEVASARVAEQGRGETASVAPPYATGPSLARSQPPPGAMPPAMLQALLRRGDDMLRSGDISAARRVYERAAFAGSREAMAAVGRTYDPAFLRSVGAIGIQGDTSTAAEWYQRAAALGDEEARNRLASFESTVGR